MTFDFCGAGRGPGSAQGTSEGRRRSSHRVVRGGPTNTPLAKPRHQGLRPVGGEKINEIITDALARAN